MYVIHILVGLCVCIGLHLMTVECDIGTVCNGEDVSTCSNITNAYICSNNTCQCNSEFAYPETGICKLYAVPGPSNLTIENINTTSFLVKWINPQSSSVNQYILTHLEQEPYDRNDFVWSGVKRLTGGDDEYLVTGLHSYWYYYVVLTGISDDGHRTKDLKSEPVQTLESAPGKPRTIRIYKVFRNFSAVKVYWFCPWKEDHNGVLSQYIFENKIDDVLQDTIYIPASKGNYLCRYNIVVKVKPSHNSTFIIKTQSTSNLTSEPYIEIYDAPIGKPNLPSLKSMAKDSEIASSSSSFTVSITPRALLDDNNGEILISALLVCTLGKCDLPSSLRDQMTVDTIKKFTTWKTAEAAEFKIPYRATSDNWLENASELIQFTIGNEEGCDDKPDTVICNGPLYSSTLYKIMLVSCSAAGCEQTYFSGIYRTADGVPVVAIVCSLVAVAVVVGIGVGIYICHKRKMFETEDSPDTPDT